MSNTSSFFRTADRLVGGALAPTLEKLNAEGLSQQAIATRLYTDYGIEVSYKTVGSWLRQVAGSKSGAAS